MAASTDLPSTANALLKALLACGILSALLVASADIIGGLLKPGYRFDSQTVSLLTSPGASTRPLVLSMDIIANFLLIAFAAGLWLSAEPNWALRVIAILIAVNAVLSTVGSSFFPWHPDQPATSRANVINTVIMAGSMFSFVFAIAFGAVANRGWLRYLSIAIVALYILATVMGVVAGSRAAANRPGASSVGVQERSMIYTWLIWLISQAAVLLRV